MALTLDEEERLSEILEAAVERNGLSDWERQFIADHAERFEEEGSEMRISGKQWIILERIAGKIGV